jgi:peptidoglycan hydrolase-like protein with peptidoglycan-binding domain
MLLRDPLRASSVSGDGDGTRPGSRNAPARQPFVLEAQRALRDLGFDPGPIDGICGPKMRAALEKYQTTEKLPATGELDGLTLQRLDVYRRLFRPTREL